MGEEILTFLPVMGAVSLAVACALWAAASNAESRRQQAVLRRRLTDVESRLEQTDAVLASEPGMVLIWGEADGAQASLPVPATDLPRGMAPMSPNQITGDFEGLMGSAERNPVEQFRTFMMRLAQGEVRKFAESLDELRGRGNGFSLVLRRKDGGEFDVTGHTLGPRAIVRVRDVTGAVREVKRLSDLLEETEAEARRFAGLMHALPVPIWRRDQDGCLDWVNDAYVRAVEAGTPEDILEKGVELEASGAARVRQLLETREAVRDRQTTVIGGERRCLDLLETPLPEGFGGIAVDRTEADGFAKALDASQEAHDRTLDRLTSAVAIFSADKTLHYSNEAFAQLWNLDPAWLKTKPTHAEVLDRLRDARALPEQRDFRSWKSDRLALYSEVVNEREEDWHLPDGRTLHLICAPHPLGGLIFLYEDVSAAIALQSDFNTLTEVQRKTLDNLDEGIAMFGTDGRLELHNEAFEKLWALTPDLLEDRPHVNEVITYCKDLYDEEQDWRAIRARATGAEEARTSVKRKIDRKDGTVLQFEVQPLRSGQTLVTFLDLTAEANVARALQDKNEALEDANRMKSALVANVSYQLRSPLNPILGYSEMLQQGIGGELNDQQADYVGNVVKGAAQLRDLIDDILDLAMIEAGTMSLDLSEVDIVSVLEGATQTRISRINDSAVSVALDVAPDIGSIQADEKRLRQVLFNLLSNATRHVSEGGRIELGANRADGQVTFWVADDGTGISAEAQVHAFDSFSTEDASAGARRPGLGLALVKSFVELHGGWVSLESSPGEGTRVTFTIPEEMEEFAVA